MAGLPTSQRDQLLLAVGILMVIAAGAYWYFVDDPQNTDLKTKVAHIDSLNAQNQRAKAQLARGSVAKIKAEADSMRANLDLLRTLVPAGSEVPALIDQVSNAARRVKLDLGAIDPITLLGGHSYAVVLDYSQNGSPYAKAAGVTIGGSGLNGYLHVTAGLSYYQPLGTNQWVDMNTLDFTSSSTDDAKGGVLFLKGYLSSVPELDPSGLSAAVTAALGSLALLDARRRRG